VTTVAEIHGADRPATFMTIDIGAWEQDSKIVTEVAVASLCAIEPMAVRAEHALTTDCQKYQNT
jgi:hypothetical protein